jgi:hypothetical protein
MAVLIPDMLNSSPHESQVTFVISKEDKEKFADVPAA